MCQILSELGGRMMIECKAAMEESNTCPQSKHQLRFPNWNTQGIEHLRTKVGSKMSLLLTLMLTVGCAGDSNSKPKKNPGPVDTRNKGPALFLPKPGEKPPENMRVIRKKGGGLQLVIDKKDE